MVIPFCSTLTECSHTLAKSDSHLLTVCVSSTKKYKLLFSDCWMFLFKIIFAIFRMKILKMASDGGMASEMYVIFLDLDMLYF